MDGILATPSLVQCSDTLPQVVADRTVVYSLLAKLVQDRLEDIQGLATMFTVGLLQVSPPTSYLLYLLPGE